ncbi:MAG: hypothetical protein EXR50_03000 [Dehalococcoidia bacterium]|nr:hypothetical protein [Dehalococcoidia bacterium]
MTDKVRQGSIAAGQDGHHPLEDLFHHRSIAVVGASTRPNGSGNEFLRGFMKMNFPGPLYPVNPKATEILSLKAYPSILDIEGPLDYVISSIPAPGVPELIRQCAQKGVKLVHMFTAGFHESGEQDRAELEEEIARTGKEGGLRLLGPNCMGIYSPGTNLSWSPEFPIEPGSVGFISQSGANASDMVGAGGRRGLRFSKVISFGNALDINEAELFDYLASDPETTVIGTYLEGVKNGKKFFNVLKEVTRRKPVVILKGGATEDGTRAVSSHTGSLAGQDAIWDSLCRQAGAIRVYGMDEMVDVVLALRHMIPPAGRRVCIVGGGGGTSVIAADDSSRVGLSVPWVSQSVQDKLRERVPIAGTSIRNPIDAGVLISRPEDFQEAVIAIGQSNEVDFFIVHVPGGFRTPRSDRRFTPEEMGEIMVKAATESGKPMAVVIRQNERYEGGNEGTQVFQEMCLKAGLAVFPSIKRAAYAMSKVMGYYEWKAQVDKGD